MRTQANTRPDHMPGPAGNWGTSKKTGSHGSQSWGRGTIGARQQKAGTWKCGVLGMFENRGLGGCQEYLVMSQSGICPEGPNWTREEGGQSITKCPRSGNSEKQVLGNAQQQHGMC